ncbi:MAG: hypothetical protein V4864_13560 [Pseudomonadota bacterium]
MTFLWRATLGLALLLGPQICLALSYHHAMDLEVQFDPGTVALPAERRTDIIQFARKVRAHDSCMDLAVALGHADPSEGPPEQTLVLAKARSAYVAQLLTLYGMSPTFAQLPPIHTLPGCSVGANTCVHVEVYLMRRGAPTCPMQSAPVR